MMTDRDCLSLIAVVWVALAAGCKQAPDSTAGTSQRYQGKEDRHAEWPVDRTDALRARFRAVQTDR